MAEDKDRAETVDRPGMVRGVDDAGEADARSEDIARRAGALRAQAPDGKFSEAAGGAAESGGTGGPAADPSDKGAYGGGGT